MSRAPGVRRCAPVERATIAFVVPKDRAVAEIRSTTARQGGESSRMETRPTADVHGDNVRAGLVGLDRHEAEIKARQCPTA
jgi:hypothetical protein